MAALQENNKLIAKNTILLYARMLFTMAISLYTSRVILNALGVEDYGIYNVTGGVILMFSFLNSAMSSATQRYITFAIGKGERDRLSVVFSTSVNIHLIIAAIVVLLGETIGLWFLIHKLVIPHERINAAMWVYQCSIVTSILSIMSVPYNADIIANEKMSAFAYISILEALLKLIIAFLIIVSPIDKLISYAVLGVFVQALIRFIYVYYCKHHFEEAKYRRVNDKALQKEMISFAGWSFFGNFAVVLFGQGVNMLLNVFFGPVVNAARAIAVQVQSAVQQFATNFQMAINPQITKNYACGNLRQMHSLMFRSARFSFFLLYILILPLILETNFILTVWLKTVPDNTVVFTRLILIVSLLTPFSSPCTIANQATGQVRKFQIVVGSLLILILPISYVVLKLGAPAYSVYIVHFVVDAIAIFTRMIMLKKQINLPVIAYFRNVFVKVIIVVVISTIIPSIFYFMMPDGLIRFFVLGLVCVLSIGLTSYCFGMSQTEKVFIKDKIRSILLHK